MLKSVSLPNLMETVTTNHKQYTMKLVIEAPPRIVSYGEFLRKNPRANKAARINAIHEFYEKLLG